MRHLETHAVAKLNHRRDVLMTEGTTRLHRKHGGRIAAMGCFAILAAHNLSRAVFWSGMSVLRKPGARARATHFAKVVRDLPRAWPKTVVPALS
mgnify:CR=1 FL=1